MAPSDSETTERPTLANACESSLSSPEAAKCLHASLDACHGHCYGLEEERRSFEAPRFAVQCSAEARPGYESMDASEYVDTPLTLQRKIRILAQLVRRSKNCIIYSGAGLSTGAGIGDYASQAAQSLSGTAPPERAAFLSDIAQAGGTPGTPAPFRSPFCAQPTLAHRVLVAMHAKGLFHRWINQNHDGLPQKAGLPQEAINEIHGAWHAPNNPVVMMSGDLRNDLFADLLDCENKADLTIAVGTSLCGMNADRVVTSCAQRAARHEQGQLGAVVIGLQRTVHDEVATVRIFARCDDVFDLLSQELELKVAPAWAEGTYFIPPVLVGRSEDTYIFENLGFNCMGERSEDKTSRLDLREDAELVITSGIHAGAIGEVVGLDREGNIRCRFKLKPKVGKLRAYVAMLLGRWWIQAAVDGTVMQLPVVNTLSEEAVGHDAECLRTLIDTYANP